MGCTTLVSAREDLEDDDTGELLVDWASAHLGVLGPGQVYGLTPAYCFTGRASTSQVGIEDAVAHLTFLAQAQERQLVEDFSAAVPRVSAPASLPAADMFAPGRVGGRRVQLQESTGSSGLRVWCFRRGGFGPGCGVRGGCGWGGEVGVGLAGTCSGRRGRARWVLVCRERPLHPQTLHVREGFGLTRTCSTSAGRCGAYKDVFGPPRTPSARRGRCPPGRGVLAAAGRSARGPGLNLHGAGPPRQNARPGCTWLPTAPAPGSGTVCCATPGLLRRFAVCNATSGLTTPVNRLLKAPGVYSRALSSVVNAQQGAPDTPTPPHAMSQDIGSTPAAAPDNHHTPKPEEHDTRGGARTRARAGIANTHRLAHALMRSETNS